MMMRLLFAILFLLPIAAHAQELSETTSDSMQMRTLGDILQQSVTGSDELAIIDARIRQALSSVGEAKSSYYPQVTVSERFGRDAANPSSARTPSDPRGSSEFVNANTTKMEVNQMLFDGFKTPAEVKRQKKLLDALQHRRRAVSNEVVHSTLEVYLTAWRHLQALRAGVAMVEDMSRVKAKVDMQAKLGAADQTVKSYVDSRLTGATQELLKTRNAYREALFRLAYMMREEVTPENFAFAPLLAPNLQGLDAYILAARTESPELMEELANKQAAEQELRRTKAGFYPTLSITSDIQDTNDVGGTVGNVRTGNAMVQLSYKLFDGFATRHGTARVKDQILESQSRLRRTSRQLEEDLSQAWRKVNATKQETQLATEETTAALKVKDLRDQDVESGQGDIVRLMESEEALYTAILKQLDLVQTLTLKKFELTLDSGQLKTLSCVDGGCPDLPMEPVTYVNPVDLPTQATSGALTSTTLPPAPPEADQQESLTEDAPAAQEAEKAEDMPEESDAPRDYETPETPAENP